MKRVLVTGGFGFIGSHVIEELLKREDVKSIHNIDNLGIGSCSNNVPYDNKITNYVVDIRDKAPILSIISDIKPTHVLHLAAESHVDRSITFPSSFISTNVIGTSNILDCVRVESPTARVVHVSTDEVYGHLTSIHDQPFIEDTPLRPRSPYSSSKASSDLIALSFKETYNMDIVVTRCCNNYGERQFDEKFIPTIVRSIVRGVKIPVYGTGENVREWIYVKDHAKALIELALDTHTPESIYNIPGKKLLSNLELIKHIVSIIEKKYVQYKKDNYVTHVEDRLAHDFCYMLESKYKLNALKNQEEFNDALERTVDYFVNAIIKE